MRPYRDPTFDAVAGIEKRQSQPLAFFQSQPVKTDIEKKQQQKIKNRRRIRALVKKQMNK